MSTEETSSDACGAEAKNTAEPFDLDGAWRLEDQVSIRPERFGALLYHFGTRRLTFLKSPVLLAVVRGLAEQPSARAACVRAGVSSAELPRYRAALSALATSQMIHRRSP